MHISFSTRILASYVQDYTHHTHTHTHTHTQTQCVTTTAHTEELQLHTQPFHTSSSFPPSLLPSFPPSLFPSFPPSLFPSFLPSLLSFLSILSADLSLHVQPPLLSFSHLFPLSPDIEREGCYAYVCKKVSAAKFGELHTANHNL